MRGDLLLVFIGRRESWQGLLQLSKSLPILPSLAQLVSSQKLTQLVLLHQTHHLRSESSKQISHLSIYVESKLQSYHLPRNGRIRPLPSGN